MWDKQKENLLHKSFIVAWGAQKLTTGKAVIGRPHDALVTNGHFLSVISIGLICIYIREYNHILTKQKEHHLHNSFVIAWGAQKLTTGMAAVSSKPTMMLSSQTAIFFWKLVQTSCMVIWDLLSSLALASILSPSAASLCGATKCHKCGAAVQIELHDLAIRTVKILYSTKWNFCPGVEFCMVCGSENSTFHTTLSGINTSLWLKNTSIFGQYPYLLHNPNK